MNVSVIGTGYVGLVAAACFAEHGHNVVTRDIDPKRIDTLKAGEIPIYEPGLEELVERNAKAGRLRFTVDAAEGVRGADIVILAVGSPPGPDGSPDLRQLESAIADIAPHLAPKTVVVNKSTVPVGTADFVAERLQSLGVDPTSFAVASNPEFLKEGSAVEDFMHPDRVVVGTNEVWARDKMRLLYAPFFRASDRLIEMDARSAELTKYAANAYLATRVSFINDIANLCDACGASIDDVRRGMGSDKRIGNHFLYPGVGYGGSCFPKDTQALVHAARRWGRGLEIVEAAERVNAGQKSLMVERLRARFEDLKGKRIALWGLAFKPNTDDVREAPALTIASALLEAGAEVRGCDPIAGDNFVRALGNLGPKLELHDDPYEAARDADALVLVTEWRQFRSPDFVHLARLMRGRSIYDGRNQWSRAAAEEAGFEYSAVGRGTQKG